ncbi:hypothetical protein JI721_13115 [Alicyclobacillus cycloheptanicus]|uniref:Uncharacterized protein n=1 Tax=Alicyclobacillus cycloheptanicus TaxID=1457 RepID=A0ABT9XEH7_9BACL|nr:hypothetical protein [Alicyclobacillus cycloheptanicus]MDQ0188698.1 hypothetical protein [Alicyclobacillus cycloheptanicus]WDM00631.1 hypothetical protein JI721_13115 [Alicyclobacillus cycloheptanicus]
MARQRLEGDVMMAVWIRGGKIQNASMSNNGGVFIGQTIQHSWDSSVMEKEAAAFAMGDGNWTAVGWAACIGQSVVRQSIHDGDVKGNFNGSHIR